MAKSKAEQVKEHLHQVAKAREDGDGKKADAAMRKALGLVHSAKAGEIPQHMMDQAGWFQATSFMADVRRKGARR